MKLKNNRYFKIGAALLLVFIVVVVVWQLLMSLKSHQLLTNADYARKAGKPLPVSTVMAQRGKLDSIVAATCTARESARVGLSVDIGGSVINVNATLGDVVSQGQLLVKLDDAVLKAALQNTKEAELTLKILKDELDPFIADVRGLRNKSLVPVTALLDAIDMQRRAELDLIRVRGERIKAEANIRNTSILAPISGVLTRLEVAVGAVLRPYEEFVVLSQLDPIWLECNFAEDALPVINDFDKAGASFPAYQGKTRAVVLEKILPVADESTHAIVAQFSLPNKEQSLLPGMQAVVRLNKVVEGVQIPAVCLINPDSDSANVFVIDEDKVARFLKVGIGRYAQGYVEVKSGLENGQRVVVVGQGSLQDGDRVIDERVEDIDLGIARTLFPAPSR